jgi:DNA polymerase III epsilon subunit-like protein
MSTRFVGLDIEATGTELEKGHRTCQIGIAFGVLDSLTHDVSWPRDVFACACDPEALKINGFTEERIHHGRAVSVAVDSYVSNWLGTTKGLGDPHRQLIGVGWNIASFDLPFIRRDLPKTAAYFHYRTVDLNALCFALGGRDGHNWEWWKKEAKKRAAEMLGREQWHDAGFDAVASLVAFWWLRERIAR